MHFVCLKKTDSYLLEGTINAYKMKRDKQQLN
jgi:hypothetical protein